MARTFPCRTCKVVYRVRKTYFSKSDRHKSGYNTECKKCKSDRSMKYYSNKSDEEKDELRIKNTERNRKWNKTEKYRKQVENYRERRKLIRNHKNWQKRTSERLRNYEQKVYWTEDQDWFLTDIKESEL